MQIKSKNFKKNVDGDIRRCQGDRELQTAKGHKMKNQNKTKGKAPALPKVVAVTADTHARLVNHCRQRGMKLGAAATRMIDRCLALEEEAAR